MFSGIKFQKERARRLTEEYLQDIYGGIKEDCIPTSECIDPADFDSYKDDYYGRFTLRGGVLL